MGRADGHKSQDRSLTGQAAMPRQGELLDKPKKPRRVLARMIDAGNYPDGRMAVHWACRKCGWVQWMPVANMTEGKRGHPCPQCNPN